MPISFGDEAPVSAIAEHFPTLPAMIKHRQVLTPLDSEYAGAIGLMSVDGLDFGKLGSWLVSNTTTSRAARITWPT